MKKILISLFLASLLIPAFSYSADSSTYTLDLGAGITYPSDGDPPSGTTMVGSGTSILVISTKGLKRSHGRNTIANIGELEGYFTFQLSEVTPCQSQLSAGGDWSGTTLTVQYKTSNHDTDEHWAAETATTILNGVAISGTTRVKVNMTPTWAKFMRLEVVSGITALGWLSGVLYAK